MAVNRPAPIRWVTIQGRRVPITPPAGRRPAAPFSPLRFREEHLAREGLHRFPRARRFEDWTAPENVPPLLRDLVRFALEAEPPRPGRSYRAHFGVLPPLGPSQLDRLEAALRSLLRKAQRGEPPRADWDDLEERHWRARDALHWLRRAGLVNSGSDQLNLLGVMALANVPSVLAWAEHGHPVDQFTAALAVLAESLAGGEGSAPLEYLASRWPVRAEDVERFLLALAGASQKVSALGRVWGERLKVPLSYSRTAGLNQLYSVRPEELEDPAVARGLAWLLARLA